MSTSELIESINIKIQNLENDEAFFRLKGVREIMENDDYKKLVQSKNELLLQLEKINLSIAKIDSTFKNANTFKKKASDDLIKFATGESSTSKWSDLTSEEKKPIERPPLAEIKLQQQPVAEVWKNAPKCGKPKLTPKVIVPKQQKIIIETINSEKYLNVANFLAKEEPQLWQIMEKLVIKDGDYHTAIRLPIHYINDAEKQIKISRRDLCVPRNGGKCLNTDCRFFHSEDPKGKYFPITMTNLVKRENSYENLGIECKDFIMNRTIAVVLLGLLNRTGKCKYELF